LTYAASHYVASW